MKLLACLKCADVFKLIADTVRTCECGLCVGVVRGGQAYVNGNGLCLGLASPDIATAATHPDRYPAIRCWARPPEGKGNPRCHIDPTLTP